MLVSKQPAGGHNLLLVSTWNSSHWPLWLHVWSSSLCAIPYFPEDLLHNLAMQRGEPDQPVIPWVFLLLLFKNGDFSVRGPSSDNHNLSSVMDSGLTTSSASSLRIWGCIHQDNSLMSPSLTLPSRYFIAVSHSTCQSHRPSQRVSVLAIRP